jgi:seryl-tRNA synthetase
VVRCRYDLCDDRVRNAWINVLRKRKTQIKKAEENRKHQMNLLKEKRKQKNNSNEEDIESNEIFAFIAGYTDSGVPFGITQEEILEVEFGLNKKEKLLIKSNFVIEDDNLPF